jgi:hypothetical protein
VRAAHTIVIGMRRIVTTGDAAARIPLFPIDLST